ncbi:MAG: hypothetical protein ACO1TE_11390 [Prosthecobacter sp.]
MATAFPPGNGATISITVRERKPPSIGYTDAMVQAGMSQGLIGAAVVGIARGGEMKRTWAFSKKWIAAGGDSRRTAAEEYRRAFEKAGYVVDDASPQKVTLSLTTPGITSTSQRGHFKAMAGPWVDAQLPDGRHAYDTFMARAFSDTVFPLDGLSAEIYDKALREAYQKSATLVLYGHPKR